MKKEFLKLMQEMLGDEYPAFLACLDREPVRGLRVNLLKSDREETEALLKGMLRPSAFADNGYVFDKPAGFGFSLPARSGIVYMQEPSASAAVTVMRPGMNMNILDLCAAPGSKTTQIAEKMQGTGFLAANEYVSKRSLILQENVIYNGAPNCMIINSDTKDVADAFSGFFDMVLCDAPCSGEGMMRKNDTASEEWSLENVELCAARQQEILHNAYRALKPEGILVYSTCTFNMQENEHNIERFLEEHPDMEILPADVSFGRCGYGMKDAVRIFPMDGGEGHFIVRMAKHGGTYHEPLLLKSEKIPAGVREALREIITEDYPYYLMRKGMLYGGTAPFYAPGKCRMVSHQVFLGEWIRNRFEPSHHLFMSSFGNFINRYDMSDDDALKYIHGEQLSHEGPKGFYAMCWHGHPIGGAKCDGRYLKNRYPKNLRLRAG